MLAAADRSLAAVVTVARHFFQNSSHNLARLRHTAVVHCFDELRSGERLPMRTFGHHRVAIGRAPTLLGGIQIL